MKEKDLSKDSVIWRDLAIYQKKSGYRFSMDSVILSRLIKCRSKESILEIGSGSGVAVFIIDRLNRVKKITGVEIQKDLYELSLKNLKANKVRNKIEFVNQDVKIFAKEPKEKLDIIISNPPFYSKNSGKLNKNSEDTVARHEINLDLNDFVNSAKKLLKPKGRLCFIHLAGRVSNIIHTLKKSGIEPKLIIPIYPQPGESADLVWVQAVNNAKSELKFLSPLFCYAKRGEKTDELKSFYLQSNSKLRALYPEILS